MTEDRVEVRTCSRLSVDKAETRKYQVTHREKNTWKTRTAQQKTDPFASRQYDDGVQYTFSSLLSNGQQAVC